MLIIYTDDILLVCASLAVITEHIKELDGVHYLLDPLIVTRRKLCEYVGTLLNFRAIEKAYDIT